MWNIAVFGIMLVFISLSEARSPKATESFNCYADFLKRHGMLEDQFKSEPYYGEAGMCAVILTKTIDGAYDMLFREFQKNTDLNIAAECIVDNLRKENFSDLDLKEHVYEASPYLSRQLKDEKIKELKKKQKQISAEAILACLAEQEFGEMFDNLYKNSTGDDEDDLLGDYCARKYGIDNNLIDLRIYQLEINPRAINVSEVKCKSINEKHFQEAEKELQKYLESESGISTEKVNCFLEKYHDNHYFDRTLSIALLSEINITTEQKDEERRKFIEIMTNITKVIASC